MQTCHQVLVTNLTQHHYSDNLTSVKFGNYWFTKVFCYQLWSWIIKIQMCLTTRLYMNIRQAFIRCCVQTTLVIDLNGNFKSQSVQIASNKNLLERLVKMHVLVKILKILTALRFLLSAHVQLFRLLLAWPSQLIDI